MRLAKIPVIWVGGVTETRTIAINPYSLSEVTPLTEKTTSIRVSGVTLTADLSFKAVCDLIDEAFNASFVPSPRRQETSYVIAHTEH
jgi:hypothetical protein